MIFISEQKEGRKTIFVSNVVSDSGEVISQKKVTYPLYQVSHEGFPYFLLYDDKMVPVREVYEYLNFALQESPLTSRSKAANALRLLYCFLSLSQHSFADFDEKVMCEFLYFIRGINVTPGQFSLITQRSNATVNGYFSIYRAFFKHIGVECSPLFRSHNVRVNSVFNDLDAKTIRTKFDNNLKINSYTDRYVPKYISPNDFRQIYQTVTAAGDKQAQIILHLMYGYGMRLGEVLGLTLEDIEVIKNDGKLIPVLWLRNRLSDKKYQYAKGLPHVIDKKQYSSKDYKSAKEKIMLTQDFYQTLLAYLEDEFENAEINHAKNMGSALADIVSEKYEHEDNYYIFLNRYGKVLSDQVWNNKLRRYFVESGLIVDVGVRENNLSHRFRHGFAMFHAHFSPQHVDILALQRLMRHRSTSSTMVYYNPTPEDEYNIKKEFQKELYELMPELAIGGINE